MSTNYYINGYPEEDMDSPEWHLGKRVSIGDGKTKFIWACPLTMIQIAEKVTEQGYDLKVCIINEYGELMSVSDFLNLVLNCDIIDTQSVGKEFS